MNRLVLLGWVLVLVLAACADSREDITEEFLPDTGLSSTTITSPPSTTRPALAPEVEVEMLAEHVRESRHQAFRSPVVEFRSADDVEQAYRELHGLPLVGDEGFDTAYLRLLGVLEEGLSLADVDGYCPVPGFYDPETATLVLADDVVELTPLGRRHLVSELTAAAAGEGGEST